MSIKTTSAALLAAVTLLAAGGCAGDRNQYDATGNFEATEVVVSSEVNGRILEFPISEGSPVHSGEQVGLIDSTQLHLQRLQVESNILASCPGSSSPLWRNSSPSNSAKGSAWRT